MCGCLQPNSKTRYTSFKTYNRLIVNCFTWLKLSKDLFDYDNDKVKVKSKRLNIQTPVKIICNDKDISIADRYVEINPKLKILANIGILKNQYWIYSMPKVSSAEEELWIVLRKYIDEYGIKGYKLNEGVVIKMGRCRYTVKELVVDSEIIKMEKNIQAEEVPIVNVLDKQPGIMFESTLPDLDKNEERQCRVCLGDDNEMSNRLIESPCLCIGSVKFIHIDCLNQWLKSKVTKKETKAAVTYSWKQFECDVCKKLYTSRLIIIY